ncbi:MarR family transcriptional regulator [Nocardioides immobilis]|uniref:MarR family transcriptional regulator n=1 Tax=Nocardioides immobilis TaxID=2049295 RepID=UPI001FE4F030|nr:helix-turn-helix domain-containing protein [Nocardioides immobilis]
MATIAERILEAIRFRPMDDDQLARRLGVSQRQSINQTARRLEAKGLLRRHVGPDGKIVNALPDATAPGPTVASTRSSTIAAAGTSTSIQPISECGRRSKAGRYRRLKSDRFRAETVQFSSAADSEDEVKAAVRDMLAAEGFEVQVAWGRTPGIDIAASHPDGRRWVVEAKAELGAAGPQQHNYFVGMLGELVQRMDDPTASYAIAMPDNRQYRGLVQRLPTLARERLMLSVFWVSRTNTSLVVTADPPA